MAAEVSTSQAAGRQKVLDEDEWTECVEAIIQRDYFPVVPKLQNKLEWLEAVRSRDPELLRQAQLNIAQRRAGIRTPMGATPAHFATPGMTSFRAPPSMLRTPGGVLTPGPGNMDGSAGQELPQLEPSMAALAVEGMSLDKFMAKHTSEDNASFVQIMEDSNKRRRLNKPWLFEQQDKGQLLLEDIKDRPLDGYGTTGQPNGRLLEWPYVGKNGLYYGRDAVALSDAEKSMQVQGPPKAINRTGTRFTPAAAPGAETPSATDDSPSISSMAGSNALGQEYSILATPSFTPGVEDSPFITWGDIQGTPLRLDPEDDIEVDPAGASGPQFTIAERSGKDALARRLGQTAAAKLRQRTATAHRRAPLPTPGAMPRPGSTPSRKGRPTSVTPARPQLSHAGKKLAQTLHGKASSDMQLRASYSGTPSKRPLGGTPLLNGMGQPTPGRTPLHKVPPPKFQSRLAAAGSAPAAESVAEERQQASAVEEKQADEPPQSRGKSGAGLTDDLLNILRDEAVQKHVGAMRDKAVQHHVGAIREKALKQLASDKES